ncbi:MAG: hypothetical protein CMJ31_00060 [Phycisphaerae bacterium]|nr:hypothetical protein [Phycisphaerae bacterium]
MKVSMSFVGLACAVVAASGGVGDPWADTVVNYVRGSNPAGGFTDPTAALGSPTRVTAPESMFGGPVTPFNPSFGAGETVSIGEGGSLTLAFDEAVTDDALNPFGIDLLIFGNAFYFDLDFPNGIAGPLSTEGGVIELSADGVNFFQVTGAEADGGFPTLAFNLDGTPTDFTRPVDPNFDASGASFDDIVNGYAGSGGGLGIDIASIGLSSVSYVRISNPFGSGVTPEIDALADVRAIPVPGTLVLVGVGGLLAGKRRRA